MLYAIGIPEVLAKEEVLRQPKYFGKYGTIRKIAIASNPSKNRAVNNNTHVFSAYVTYTTPKATKAAIRALHNRPLDYNITNGYNSKPQLIRCTYGTTKYCSYFLKGLECTTPDCLFLHVVAAEEDSYAKDDYSLKD